MDSDAIEKLLIILIILVFIGLLIWGITESEDYIYICTDVQGNTIYCTYAYISKGGMFGTLEDGTIITITSYKQIRKETEEM